MSVSDGPGMLRVRLLEDQRSSGSGNNYPTALVVAEHAERAAFARQALAVKLRELDAVCTERDRLDAEAERITKECRVLVNACEFNDGNLVAAVRGNLRRAV